MHASFRLTQSRTVLVLLTWGCLSGTAQVAGRDAKQEPVAPAPWRAQWVGCGPAVEPRPVPGVLTNASQLTNLAQRVEYDGRSVLLRKEFVLTRPLRKASVRATGLGYFELYCNGKRLGEQMLAPVHSNYRKWVLYETFDITGLLKPGIQFANAFPLYLGLVPSNGTGAVVGHILRDLDRHDSHFTVGVLGPNYLLDALTRQARPDVAYRLVKQTGFPSWAQLLDEAAPR